VTTLEALAGDADPSSWINASVVARIFLGLILAGLVWLSLLSVLIKDAQDLSLLSASMKEAQYLTKELKREADRFMNEFEKEL